MNLRWLLWDYVDPSVPLRPGERRAVRVEAWRELRTGRTSPLDPDRRNVTRLRLVQALIPATVMGATFVVAQQTGLFRNAWVLVPLVLVQIVVSVALMGLAGGHILGPRVHAMLRRRGYDVCTKCGYLMTGHGQEARCPECGETRVA